MKPLIALLMMGMLTLAGGAAADELDAGIAAYDRGEYETAVRQLDLWLARGTAQPRAGTAFYYRALAAESVLERETFLVRAINSGTLDAVRMPAALLELGTLYLLGGRDELAEAACERIGREYPLSAAAGEGAYYAALAKIRRQNLDQAIEYLRALARRSPALPDLDRVEAALATALAEKRDYAGADRVLHNMLLGFPETPYKSWIYFQLGENYRLRNDVPQAVAAYRQVTDKFPQSPQAELARAALSELSASPRPAGPAVPVGPPAPSLPGVPTVRTSEPAPPVSPITTPAPAGPEFSATGAFTVQVVALTAESAARQYANNLRASGYPLVDVKAVAVRGQTYYKVRAGRFATRDGADRYRLELAGRGLDGFVTGW